MDGAVRDGVRAVLAGGDVVNAQRLVVPVAEGNRIGGPCRVPCGQGAVVRNVCQGRAGPAEERIGIARVVRSGRRLDLASLHWIGHRGAIGHDAPE